VARRRKEAQTLTPAELQIMQALWRDGPGNVQHVQKSLSAEVDFAYTTVQTMLNVLHRKGRVRRALKGRAFEYFPTLSKEKALGQTVRDLVDRMFGGSSEDLVMSLIKSRQIDPTRIADLSRKLAALEKDEQDG
jgi:predicted transcriptional regulator